MYLKVKSNFLFLSVLLNLSVCLGQVTVTPLQFPTLNVDYIIVGGGSAGSTLASRLTDNPNIKVLLIEAGTYPGLLTKPPGLFLIDTLGPGTWQYPIEPQTECFYSFTGQKFFYAQGKVLGGGSSINDMMYVRGNRMTFDRWAALGLTDWSYANVLPYFLRAEGNQIPGQMDDKIYHNTSGPLTVSSLRYPTTSLNNFLQGSAQQGLLLTDYNGANQTGAAPIDFTIRDGSRCSTYVAYLNTSPIKQNLFLSLNSVVTKVLINNQTKTAYGVEVIVYGLKFSVNASKEVILSAGAFASPKLLMLSGIGPRSQLEQFNVTVIRDTPGVGENLQDHLSCLALIWKVNCTDCTYKFSDEFSLGSFFNYVLFKQGPLTSPIGIEGLAFVETKYSEGGIPDIQLLYAGNSFTTVGLAQSWITEINYDILSKYYAPFASAQNTFTIVPFMVQPKSLGYVRLNSSDPTAYPIVNFNYLKEEQDVLTFIEGMKIAKAIGDSDAFKAIGAEFINTTYPGCESYELYTDDYWNCTVRSFNYLLYHPVGTCKMGLLNDTMAVVDTNLKVIGINNLRVVDNSIMPLITNGNTNAPAIMIGEKGANIILSSLL